MRFAPRPEDLKAQRIATGEADLWFGDQVRHEALVGALGHVRAELQGEEEHGVGHVQGFVGEHRATVDLDVTMVQGDLIKVLAWYDNEAGYSQRMFDLAKFVAEKL